MTHFSLCMIVKNEESVLNRCLDSIADLMDEIIIVDTGSTDKTKEIAATYTDKVYDFEWTGNFSDARNFSISKASCEYIYCADADEVLDKENHDKLRVLKEAMLPEIEIVQMLYSGQYENNTVYNFDEEYRPKLFKRLRSFSFMNPVHETLRLDPIVYDSDIRIFHKPHGNHSGRDLSIFLNHYIDSSTPISSAQLSMYAKELYISGKEEDFTAAIPIFERILAKENCSKSDLIQTTAVLAKAYLLKNDAASFHKYAMKNVLSDGCSETCYELGCYYEKLGDYAEANMWFYNAINECSPCLNIHYGDSLPKDGMERCKAHL